MTIRLFGIGMMICSALCYSRALIKGARRKIAQLEELCDFISYIKRNIEAFVSPIHEIVSSYEIETEELKDFMKAAAKNGLLSAAVTSDLVIGNEGKRLLTAFASKIGGGYKEDEMQLCIYYHDQMSQLLQREKAETEKRMKMYKTLPVMSAISLALMLI